MTRELASGSGAAGAVTVASDTVDVDGCGVASTDADVEGVAAGSSLTRSGTLILVIASWIP